MPNLSNKLPKIGLSKLFFYLLVFLIPIQTRKVFFTANSFYYGFHSFYNTFYVYLTDILIFGLIIAWISPFIFSPSKRGRLRGGILSVKQDPIYLVVVLFWLILAISIIVSHETILSLLGLVKTTEFLLLFAYIRENVSRETFRTIFWIFLASMSLQALLGIVQYLGQSSLGLKFLGEEYLRPGLRDIAEFVSHGVASPWFYQSFPYLSPISDISVNLRAYGTFSHPNVFAGLLFMGILVNLYLLFHVKQKVLSRETILLSLFLLIIITGLVVTFSRFTLLLTGAGILLWFLAVFLAIRRPYMQGIHSGARFHVKEFYKPQNLAIILMLILMIASINYFLFHQQIQDRFFGVRTGKAESDVLESLGDRELLGGIAVKMIKQKPLLGVGLKNFVVRMQDYADEKLMPYSHQPVHNIYLLVAAESGIFALVAFLILLFLIIKRGLRSEAPLDLKITLLIIFFGFLAIGLVDHFPLTLQQGSIAFWLVAGLLSAKV